MMLKNHFLISGVCLTLWLTGCTSSEPTTNVASPATEMASATPATDAAMKAVLQTTIADYVKQQNAPLDTNHRYFADTIDLNGDGIQDGVVVFSSSYWCGTGGCTMLIFEGQQDKTFRLVSETTLVRPPVTVS